MKMLKKRVVDILVHYVIHARPLPLDIAVTWGSKREGQPRQGPE